MSDDYVIEWDLAFAEYLKTLACIFLKEKPGLWPDLVSRLAHDPASFEDDEDDDYGIVDVLDCSGGDLDNSALLQAFMQVLRAKGVIEEIDYKGEDEEGQLATFAANRYYDLTKDVNTADELKTRLLTVTKYDEIGKVCKKGGRYVDEIFERIQSQLNERGFQIASLNEGTDAYNIFVLSMDDYEQIADFDTSWLEVQDFLS
ncbi:cytoplasmic protein [Salmonella enterica subsp. salamae]|nr:cytoplasmic protein [Salmonella enterica]EBP4576700.1 cytoplasmic protein [Salmonella enterica]ECJ5919540.1 cytoplasmic protein [Salmonella enterica subsp. salamae]ECW0043565.1 cytoplasmic protein [Salmonella enterica]